MTPIVPAIFELETLPQLEAFLLSIPDRDKLRHELHEQFMEYANYSTAQQWNRAVRLCECLAIIGWGKYTAVEALAGKYFNGSPDTFFRTPDNKIMYLDAVWAQRDGGMIVDPHLSFIHDLPGAEIKSEVSPDTRLESQRNWLPKCPIRIVRTLDNCYPSTRPLVDSIENVLSPALVREMRPQLYGRALNRIYLNCCFSYFDNDHCKTNYIIADPALKLRKSELYSALLNMYSAAEIERQGLFLRPRYEIGPFRKDTGIINVKIVFEKEFSELSLENQKKTISQYFLSVIESIAQRNKKADYDFRLMYSDFERVLSSWLSNSL